MAEPIIPRCSRCYYSTLAMSDPIDQPDPMFPRLDAAQITRLVPFARRRGVAPGEVIFERGSVTRAFYVLLDGQMEITTPSREGQ